MPSTGTINGCSRKYAESEPSIGTHVARQRFPIEPRTLHCDRAVQSLAAVPAQGSARACSRTSWRRRPRRRASRKGARCERRCRTTRKTLQVSSPKHQPAAVPASAFPATLSSAAICAMPSSIVREWCIEQNFGPHMLQNSALLKYSAGSVSS